MDTEKTGKFGMHCFGMVRIQIDDSSIFTKTGGLGLNLIKNLTMSHSKIV